MNQQKQKPRVVREVTSEWDEIMTLASQIKFGEIIIKIQDQKVILTEYRIKRKGEETDEFTAFPL